MVQHNAYGNAARRAFADLVGDLGDVATTVRVALLANTYTPDRTAHETFDQVSADEVSGATGYTAGGDEITNKALTETGNVTTFDGDDVTWEASTITAAYAVVYEDTGTPGTSTLLTLVDFEGDETSDNGDFTISWDASGIFTVDAS